MTTAGPAEYFRQHSALADWLRAVSPTERDSILVEDATRSTRLEFLSETIGLPIVATVIFSGAEVQAGAPRFAQFVEAARGPYALRAFKVDNRDQVFRNRNLPVPQLIDWLRALNLDVPAYELEFSQHLPNEWATILVVTESGVLGELVRGSLRQLTQGGHSAGSFVSFTYDFTEWWIDATDPRWRDMAESVLARITVDDPDTRRLLRERLGCEFADGRYLRGYFEAIGAPGGDIRFIDFNMSLGRQLEGSYIGLIRAERQPRTGEVHGRTASRGQTTAVARVVMYNSAAPSMLTDGEVLVCVEPTPDMVPLLAKAGGLVADRGGVLSHASIVCRELGIPCVVATTNATEVIPDGAVVTVDADSGTVRVHPADE